MSTYPENFSFEMRDNSNYQHQNHSQSNSYNTMNKNENTNIIYSSLSSSSSSSSSPPAAQSAPSIPNNHQMRYEQHHHHHHHTLPYNQYNTNVTHLANNRNSDEYLNSCSKRFRPSIHENPDQNQNYYLQNNNTTSTYQHHEIRSKYLECNTNSSFLMQQSYSSTASLSASSTNSTNSDLVIPNSSSNLSIYEAYQGITINPTHYNGSKHGQDGEGEDQFKNRQKRVVANERERTRMHNLNTAFEKLRSVLPSLSSKQFSKFETLQMAKSYIEALTEILVDEENIQGDLPLVNNQLTECDHNDFKFENDRKNYKIRFNFENKMKTSVFANK